MKKRYLILPVLIFACSGPKELEQPTKENTSQESIKDLKMKNEADYICNVEVIKNLMPSADTERTMYAIVTLLPQSGKIEYNWKVLTFEIDGVQYTTFDKTEFNGKDLLIYRNNVRKIPLNIKTPFSAKVVFENEKGLRLNYELNMLEIFEVH